MIKKLQKYSITIFVTLRKIYNYQKILLFGSRQLNPILTVTLALKLPIPTPLVSIYIETGILPLNLECEKCQLMYLWTLLNKKDQSNDIAKMQLNEFSQNQNNLLNYITGLIKKFNVPTAHIDLQNISKLEKYSSQTRKKIYKQPLLNKRKEPLKTKIPI